MAPPKRTGTGALDNFVWQIKEKWEETPKNNELVLVFKIGGSGACFNPLFLEVTPPPQRPENAGRFQPDPITYLDCSGLQFRPKENGEGSGKSFVSLLMLARYLKTVQYVKVLLITTDVFSNQEWISSFLSCPAIHILPKLQESAHLSSFGLVVVTQKEKCSTPKDSTSQPPKQDFGALRRAFLEKLREVKRSLSTEGETSQHGQRREKDLQMSFIDKFIRTEKFVILEQDRIWDGKVFSLIRLPTPPGFRIAQFCQQKLRVSMDITDELLWSVVRDSERAGNFVPFAKKLENHYCTMISKHGSSLLDLISHYATELNVQPKRESHLEVASKVSKSLEISQNECPLSDCYARVMQLALIMDCPLDLETETKFRGQQEQHELLSNVLTELQQRDEVSHATAIKFERFHKALKSKVIPRLSKLLVKERDGICITLQAFYLSQTEHLIKFNNANNSIHLQSETRRLEALDMLAKDLELLKMLDGNSSSKSLIAVYRRLSSVHHKKLMEILQVEQLEEEFEACLRDLQQEYISCRYHSAITTTSKLKENLEDWKEKLITCNTLVSYLTYEINDLVNSITTSFQDTVLKADLNLKTIGGKRDTISSLLLKMKDDHFKETCSGNEMIIPDQVEYISKLLLNRSAEESVKLKILKLQAELEFLLEDFRQLKSSIIRTCISSLSSMQNKLDGWNKCLSLVTFLKDYAATFEYHHHSTLGASPITTDADLISHLQTVLTKPQQKVLLNAFRSHAWDDLNAFAMKIINYAAKRKVGFSQKSVCSVAGNYIKFSDFCHLHQLRSDALKEVRIVAREAVFIDADMYDGQGRELEVFVIAPCVEVVNDKEINLDGRNAENYNTGAWNAYAPSQGQAGRPGKPGGNAGRFHIICESINNAPLLRVNCRGGNGGGGQNGGNGRDGSSGRDGSIGDLPNGVGTCAGQLGQPGGDGGDGGMGGHPGYGGSVKVDCYGSHDGAVKVSTRNGEWGTDGKGGRGGQGGKKGNGFKREKVLWWHKEETVSCGIRAPDGNPGMNGTNIKGKVEPGRKHGPMSLGEAISDFRQLCMTQQAESAKELLAKIDEHLEMSVLTPQLLANDLFKLEAGQETNQLISEHEAFQNRLFRYSKWKAENGGADSETKYVLSLLYTFSVSKALVLKSHQNDNNIQGVQVINIQGYFDTVAENIKRLESSHIELDRRNALQDYQQHLHRKCEDTQNHIAKTVLPAIESAKRGIQAEIENCLKELSTYENQVEEDLHKRCQKYYEYAESAQRWQTFRTVLSVLNVGCEITFLFGKFFPGLLAAASITNVITGGLMKIVDKNSPEVPSSEPGVELPRSLNVTSDFLPEMRERGNAMARQIELIRDLLEMHTELLPEISQILERWSKSVENFRLVPDSNICDAYTELAEMERCREECLEVVSRWTESEKISPETKADVDRLVLQLNICNCDPNFDTKGIDAKLDISGITDPQLRSIKKRQMTIYEVLIPLVKTITEGQSENASSAESAADRKVKRWRMRKTLRDLKDKMSDFVKDMRSEKMLIASIQNFEEAMSLLSQLCDMMEQYEESKTFSDTLHQLTTQQVEVAGSITDPELKNIVTKVNFLLKGNAFLLDYNEAVKSFKQWVFPFANKYLPSAQESSLDTELRLEGDGDDYQQQLQKWMKFYVERFEELRGHIGRYKTMTTESDSVAFTGAFSSAFTTICPPFFVWKWNEYGDPIGKLLAGEEVQLRSSIRNPSLKNGGRRGAVKFKSVQLVLKHRKGYDSREQKELNRILKGYTVTMTHSGISYYRVFEKCFVIRGNKQEYCYSFDESTRNMTYEKTGSSGSDYLLSPYTMWTFKLNNVGGGDDSGKGLRKFAGHVSLQLEGDGWYVDEEAALSKGMDKDYLRDLHNHYELIDW